MGPGSVTHAGCWVCLNHGPLHLKLSAHLLGSLQQQQKHDVQKVANNLQIIIVHALYLFAAHTTNITE